MRAVLSQRIIDEVNYSERRDALSHDWISFLNEFNILPFPIPNCEKHIKSYLDVIKPDLIILTGGNTVEISKNDSTMQKNGIYESRNNTECKMIDYAIKNKIPLLGICRGLQMIQVYFGGELSTLEKVPLTHVSKDHNVMISSRMFLERYRTEVITVNSFHNQGIYLNNLADGLLPFAVVPEDNTVEGVFHLEYPIIGIMWHPERKSPSSKFDKDIFEYLIEHMKR